MRVSGKALAAGFRLPARACLSGLAAQFFNQLEDIGRPSRFEFHGLVGGWVNEL